MDNFIKCIQTHTYTDTYMHINFNYHSKQNLDWNYSRDSEKQMIILCMKIYKLDYCIFSQEIFETKTTNKQTLEQLGSPKKIVELSFVWSEFGIWFGRYDLKSFFGTTSLGIAYSL